MDAVELPARLRRNSLLEEPEHRRPDTLRANVVLQELRHDSAPCQQVRERDEPDVAAEPSAENEPGRDEPPPGHHHRPAKQHRLERSGARREHHHVRRAHHRARFTIDEGDRRAARVRHPPELGVQRGTRHRSGEAQIRPAAVQPGGRLEQRTTDVPHLPRTASRKQGHDGSRLGKTETVAGRRAVLVPQLLGERMTHEAGADAVSAAELGLEWKQGEDAVHRLTDLCGTIGAPCPHRGTHVVDGGDPGRAQPPFQGQIEVGCVDPDEHVRSGGLQPLREPAPLGNELDESARGLEQPHDRKTLHREERIEPESMHLRAADPAEASLGLGGANGAHETRSEQVARHLAGDHCDGGAGHRRPWRTMPRLEAARKSMKGTTSGQPSRIFSSCSRASGTRSPSR